MTPVPQEEIFDSILRIRTPLARIELAASRLARDAATPAARDFAIGISQAVREIDDEIGDALGTLRPEPGATVDVGDCGPILTALRARMIPILQAYEIDWRPVESGDQQIGGDRLAFERAAVVMLRAGIALAGRAGTIHLSMVQDTDVPRIGLCLTTHRREGAAANAESDAIAQARAFAHRFQGSLDVRPSEGASIVTLWLTPLEGN